MDIGDFSYNPFASSWGAVAFWTFIAVVSVAGTLSPVFKNRETQKTIRQAIERGETLDPALLDRLMDREETVPSRPRDTLFAGLVTMASGVGVGLMSVFIGMDEGEPVWVILGAGLLVFLIGATITGFAVWSLREERDGRAP